MPVSEMLLIYFEVDDLLLWCVADREKTPELSRTLKHKTERINTYLFEYIYINYYCVFIMCFLSNLNNYVVYMYIKTAISYAMILPMSQINVNCDEVNDVNMQFLIYNSVLTVF